MRVALAALAAALLAILVLFGTPRPPVVVTTAVDRATVSTLLGDLAIVTGLPGDLRVARPRQADCALQVQPIALAAPDTVGTRHFALRMLPIAADDGACGRWQADLVDQLRDRDIAPDSVRPGADLPPRSRFATWLLMLAAAGIGALPVLVWALLRAMPPAVRRQVLLVFVLALAVRALAPHRLTTVYFAYEWFAQARYLDSLPRYGPGSTALWGLILGPVTVNHMAILWLQSLLGAATVAAGAAWLRLATGSARAGWLGAAVLGLTPLLVREHNSESMHVPAVAAVLVAAVAALRVQDGTSSHVARWTIGVALGIAPLFRADVAPLAAPTVAVLTWIAHGRWPRPNRTWLAPGAVALLGTGLALDHALLHAELDAARGTLPQLHGYLAALPGHLRHDALPWRADWLPGAIWLPLVAWLALGKHDHRLHFRWFALLPLAVLWLLPSFTDFNETSLPRLQMPAAVLMLLLAAGLTEQIAAQLHPQRWPLGVLAAAWLASAWPTMAACGRETNPHQEDVLLRRILDMLPRDQPYWLVSRSYAEVPAVSLHLHLPTFLFQPPGRVVAATDWLKLQAEGRSPNVPVFFLRSLRCWAAPIRDSYHVPRDSRPNASHSGNPAVALHGERRPSVEHPACRAIVTAPGTLPILTQQVQNLRDTPTFDYYGDAAAFEVGLYRLRGGAP